MTAWTRRTVLMPAVLVTSAAAVIVPLALPPAAAGAIACEANWVDPGGGSWRDPGNWSTGAVPNATTVACITAPGTYTVEVGLEPGVGHGGVAEALQLGDGNTGNGSPTLQVVGTQDINGSSLDVVLTLQSASEIMSDGILELTSVGPAPVGRGILAAGNQGPVTLTNSGMLRTLDGAGGGPRQLSIAVANQPGGTLSIQSNTVLAHHNEPWTNNGTITVADGRELEIGGPGPGPTLNLAGGTVHSQGSGRLLVTNGRLVDSGGATTGSPVQICGATLDPGNASSTASFDFVRILGRCDGGRIAGDIGSNTTVRVNNTSGAANNVSVANITNNGALRMVGTSEVQLIGGTETITNNGTFEISGTGHRFLQVSLTNTATGTVDVLASAGTSHPLTNAGTFNIADARSFGTTANTTLTGGVLSAAGTGFFRQGGGTLTRTGGGTSGNPVQVCGALLNPGNVAAAASFDFVRIPGTCDGGRIGGDIGPNTTVRSNNTSDAPNNVSVANITNNGVLKMVGTAEVQLIGGTETITNNGLFEIAGTGNRFLQISLVNTASGTVDVLTSAGTSRTITSDGTFNIPSARSFGGPNFSQGGGTTTLDGTLAVDTPYALSGGTLRGSGTLNAPLNNSGGTVAPGTSPGVLTVNSNYTQGAGGTLRAEIQGTAPGTGHDRLTVNGDAVIAGTLAVEGSGFTPADADVFDVLAATGSVSGTFSSVTGLAAGGGRTYAVSYTPGPPGRVRVGVVPQFALSVSKAGSGAGTVSSSPVGIDCGGGCTQAYTADTVVTLTASPAAGSTFTGWSGDCSGASTCQVTMSQARAVTATFALVPTPPAASAPNTEITKAKVKQARGKATFSWNAITPTPGAITYECKLTGESAKLARWKSCMSAKTYSKLSPGKHVFSVRAIQGGLVDPTPAKKSFTI